MATTTNDKRNRQKEDGNKSKGRSQSSDAPINGTASTSKSPKKPDKKRKSASEAPDTDPLKSKKRKREILPANEIEVDITAPEPPSRRSLRLLKKGKAIVPPTSTSGKRTKTNDESDAAADSDSGKAAKRSDYGIWIGNLAFTITKADLRKFFTSNSTITEEQITRVHMPAPFGPAATGPVHGRTKAQNKGFAYIDFATGEALESALELSETLLTGRRVLIKNSKSFEGRPEKIDDAQASRTAAASGGKPPNNRIFVGNLGFETVEEDLRRHFERCGEVKSVFVATFEDTGKCKGFAWVEFEELESAIAAVKGFVNVPDENVESEDESVSDAEAANDSGEDAKKEKKNKKEKPKTKKVWVNRIRGRSLRMEFAEDKAVRYKKRYGKDGTVRKEDAAVENRDVGAAPDDMKINTGPATKGLKGKENPPKFVKAPKSKVDARTIKPGAALARAERRTGAIVESKGKRITFDG